MAVLLVAAAALGACAGGDGDRIPEGSLPRLVLQEGDLPDVWLRFDVGRQTGTDSPPGERADPERFGREGGWKSRYRRPGSPATVGPLVVESRADLFDSTDGARKDLDALERGISETLPGATSLSSPQLGDEALAATTVEGDVRFYVVAWRDANVTASIFLNGFDGRTNLEHALALARKQERRIAALAG